MKLKLLKISAFVVGVIPLLIEMYCDGPAWSPSRPAAEYGSRPRRRRTAYACRRASRRRRTAYACRRASTRRPIHSSIGGWEGGSAAGRVPDAPGFGGDPVSPGQALAGWEAWLRTASLRAAGPNRRPLRAPRIFPGQALAGLEVWLQTASLRAAGITDRNCHREFNLFLKGTDRSYPQLRKVSSRDQDRRARDFLIFQGKALVS